MPHRRGGGDAASACCSSTPTPGWRPTRLGRLVAAHDDAGARRPALGAAVPRRRARPTSSSRRCATPSPCWRPGIAAVRPRRLGAAWRSARASSPGPPTSPPSAASRRWPARWSRTSRWRGPIAAAGRPVRVPRRRRRRALPHVPGRRGARWSRAGPRTSPGGAAAVRVAARCSGPSAWVSAGLAIVVSAGTDPPVFAAWPTAPSPLELWWMLRRLGSFHPLTAVLFPIPLRRVHAPVRSGHSAPAGSAARSRWRGRAIDVRRGTIRDATCRCWSSSAAWATLVANVVGVGGRPRRHRLRRPPAARPTGCSTTAGCSASARSSRGLYRRLRVRRWKDRLPEAGCPLRRRDQQAPPARRRSSCSSARPGGPSSPTGGRSPAARCPRSGTRRPASSSWSPTASRVNAPVHRRSSATTGPGPTGPGPPSPLAERRRSDRGGSSGRGVARGRTARPRTSGSSMP